MPLEFILPGRELIPNGKDFEFLIPQGISMVGTPFMDNIVFPSATIKRFNEEAKLSEKVNTKTGVKEGRFLSFVNFTYDQLVLNSIQITVNQAKNIVKTSINGRSGTIKEFITHDDYSIEVNATMQELSGGFPADQIDVFKRLADVEESVPIESKILNELFGIDRVVIEKFSVSPVSGFSNASLSISMISDVEFDLRKYEVSR